MPRDYKNRVQSAISGLDSVLRDIETQSRERAQVEEEAVWSRLEAEASFKLAPVIFFLVDGERVIRRANDAALNFVGRPLDRVVGKAVGEVLECVHACSHGGGCMKSEGCAECPLNRALIETLANVRRSDNLDTTISCRCEGGGTKARHLFVSTVPFAVGETTYALLSMLDVTRWKTAQEQISRTQRLESLGTLAGGIAHDLNNLLTIILGNISLAKSFAAECGDAVSALDRATGAAFRAADLSTQLLTFASGGEPIKTSLRVEDVVRCALDRHLSAHGASATYAAPAAELPRILGDPVQIHQVLANLLDNAADATRRGGAIVVRTTDEHVGPDLDTSLPAGRYIHLEVADQGSGIAAEDLPSILDPYFTTKEGANGLGLTTAFSIVKRHGGHLRVESEEGRGTTVHAWLPVEEAAESQSSAPRPEAPATATATATSLDLAAGGRILLMDDEEWLRECTAEMLENFGWSVTCAEDGSQAIDLYEQALRDSRRFDCVILDLTVPDGMGGLETMKALLQIDPAVTGIVSSGYHHDPIMANYWEYGFSAVLPKPYSLHQLDDTIRSTLARRPRVAVGPHA